ncbi:carboxymuconolactone decarboxylase family protein [Aquimarina algicola]|uniref:Carboxymuconolactone decarboxylase family protein n=1 Tax=Aquimarina algicola TaxID=2589995 RepID=A0A504J104_9FLAO|nr:carboxymuconolactone decarboxylase family protein [Aquimarina algicola]TPN82112.1 carboxymuconolactone decarboxylase family protein [Aquimarina algicola]
MERIPYSELPEGIFEPLMAIEEKLKNSSLDNKLLELVRLRVSQINGCAYCLDMHTKELKHAGESEIRISLLSAWEESGFFDEKEKAVLHFAEALTVIDDKPLHNDVFETLQKHFDKHEISFLSLAIAQINTWNRLMKSFGFKAGNYEVAQV